MSVTLRIGSAAGPRVSLSEQGVMRGPVREVAEGTGGLVLWSAESRAATIRAAVAPDWRSLSPLAAANGGWPAHRRMAQWKLDILWTAALRVRVDPLLMVGILRQEGTGSFNTNPANSADYGGHGPENDWLIDVARAVWHVAAKIRSYQAAVNSGFRDAAASIGLAGTIIQFVNWPGPMVDHSPTWGVYAQHGSWWRGVSRYYEESGGSTDDLTVHSYDHPGAVKHPMRCQAVTNRADLCSDLTGTKPEPGVVTYLA